MYILLGAGDYDFWPFPSPRWMRGSIRKAEGRSIIPGTLANTNSCGTWLSIVAQKRDIML
jgi:hypothetical protein